MIIYLHGFASSGNSAKADALKLRFGAERVTAPDLPIDPKKVIRLVDQLVSRSAGAERLIFVGTSLGGFYANYFAQRYDAPCVLVNPSTEPSVTMTHRLGKNKNYATGEEFEITHEFIEDWASMESEIKNDINGSLIDLLVARDDEVLPCDKALAAFPYTHSTTVTEDGGHRFETHWELVVDAVAKLLK